MSERENGSTPIQPVQTEVREQPRRRRYSASYKQQIVAEVEAAPRGGLAAILRREGLYSATVETWRSEARAAHLPKKRGRKPSVDTQIKQQLERLERENAQLQRKLEQAELIIDVQKKVAQMLEIGQPRDDQR